MSIGDEFTLYGGGGEVCGVNPGPEEGQVLLSFTSGSVQLYNVCECRLVCGWKLPHSDLLACPAVCHASRDYWAINNKMSVVHWTSETTPTTSHQLESKSSPAHFLVAHSQPVVLYQDGRVGCVADPEVGVAGDGGGLAMLVPQEGVGQWRVFQGAVWGGGEEVCVVSGKGRSMAVGVARISTADGRGVVFQQVSVGVVMKKLTYRSSCVCGDQLWVCGGEGQLLRLHLHRPLESLQLVHTISPSAEFSHMLALSSDFFVLGSSHSLQLWDTRYCTCQGSTTISSLGSKLWCVEGCVWGGATGLQGWRVQVGVATLATALGKRRPPVQAMPIIQKSWPTSTKELLNWGVVSADPRSAAILKDLQNPDKVATLKTFQKKFVGVSLDALVCWRGVVERILTEARFWARQPLLQLLEAHLVPPDVDVLSVAVAKEDWALVMTSLACGVIPTEACLVSSLQAALKLPETVESEGQTISKKNILLKLLSVPFTDLVLQTCLVAMDLAQVKELLGFLCNNVGVVFLLASPTSDYPYDCLLSWMGVVIDVHFTKLLLDSSSRGLLLDLRACVLAQVRCYEYLTSLRSVRQEGVSVKPCPQDWLWKEEEVRFYYD